MNWTERIPQAIEKAEGLTGHSDVLIARGPVADGKVFIEEQTNLNATEVALAKALWSEDPELNNCAYRDSLFCGGDEVCDACTALRAFCEKVEAL